MTKWKTYWRIASTSGGLAQGHFFARKIPPPDSAKYSDFAVKAPQSQGGLTRQGYINVSLLWDNLDGLQLNVLKAVVEAAITGGTIYLTVDRADGSGIRDDFIDISGIAQPLEYEPIARTEGYVFSDVRLVVTNITVDNDPSNVL